MKVPGFLAPLAGALLVAGASISFAGANSWTLNGPEGAYASSLLIDPDDASVRLAATLGGLYRSTNAGTSWDLVATDAPNGMGNLSRDPTNHDRILATASRLVLSTDRGLTFIPVQGPATLSGLSKIAYCADGVVLVADLGGHLYKADAALSNWTEMTVPWPADNNNNIGALDTDPAHAGTIFVGVNNVGFYRSTDGGAHWSGPLTGGPVAPTNTSINSFSLDPRDSNRVLAATYAGVFRSTNGGTNWTLVSGTPSHWAGWDPLVVDRAIAVAIYGTILRSVDGGATFPQYGADLRTTNVTDATFDIHNSGHLWLATNSGIAHSLDAGTTFAYRNAGIRGNNPFDIRAADDGKIIVAVNGGTGGIFQRGANYSALGASTLRAVTSGPFQIQTVAISASNSARIYAVSNCTQLVKSTDGGATWSAPHPAFTGGSDCIWDLQIDPSDELTGYASRVNTGLWKTINGGTTWLQLVNSPPISGAVGIDPADDSHLLLAGGATGRDRIYKSVDGGTTWASTLDTQSLATFLGFAYDPVHSDVVFAYGYGGVWKSTNGGTTWTAFAATLFGQAPVSVFALDPLLPTTMTAAGHLLGDMSGFVRSVDGGATWDPVPLATPGRPYGFVYKGLLDPLAPNRLIVGVNGNGMGEYDVAPDLEITTAKTGADPAPLGLPTSFSFTVRNLGPHASSDSTVRIPLPAWTFPSLPTDCARVTGAIECKVGVLRVNQSRRFDMTVTAAATPEDARVDLTVTGHEPDPVSNNSSAHVDLQAAEQADLAVTFPGAPAAVDDHAQVTLPVDVKNDGPNASSHTVVTIELAQAGQAAALAAPVATTSQGTCALAGTTLTCTLGSLASGATAHISVAAGTSIAMTATITARADGDGIDVDTDQVAEHALKIRAVGDLAVTIEDSVDPATTGVAWKYTATIRNNGPDTSTGTVVIALNGATPSAVEAPLGICILTTTDVTCTLAPLANGATTSLVVTVNSSTVGSAGATVTATFDGTDSSATNNSAVATTTKQAPPPSPTPSGGGKSGGGGGRFEWLTLLALGALLARRRRRAAFLVR